MGQSAPFLILKGIKEASTFMGFCSEHDKAIFKPIELRPLEQDDPEQALVFYIRSICYEYAQKRRSFEFAGNLLEEFSSFGDPGFISELEGMKEMKSEWLKKDWPYYSEFAFSSLANGDFSNLRTVWRVVDKNIGISNCCIYSPLLDDHDRYMEENWDLPQPANSFNLVPTVAQTHVITSWIGNCVADSNWVIEETNTNKGLEVYINRCGFAESADICLRPSLWESLSFEKRREAEFAMAPNFIRGPLDPIPIIIEI